MSNKKKFVSQFLKQRDINSYYGWGVDWHTVEVHDLPYSLPLIIIKKLPLHVRHQLEISGLDHLCQLSSLGEWGRVPVEGESNKCWILDKLKIK